MKADEEARAKMAAGMQMQQESDLQKMHEQKQQQQEMEERKRIMVRSILEPEALERLSRIGLVKPEKKDQVEMMLLQQAQSGRITEKISDSQLSQLIEKMRLRRQKSHPCLHFSNVMFPKVSVKLLGTWEED
ncbi:unnamed protein product [Effrenium voratum]|uniref:Programmed cell death protein 5 n=1 Tax=Effrenium voratum TaxID=2562239 RepID=A0AA36IHJ2_9DINO|nr:unnamed protein product [Effrenium voratum]